jgi:hypothetical protein
MTTELGCFLSETAFFLQLTLKMQASCVCKKQPSDFFLLSYFIHNQDYRLKFFRFSLNFLFNQMGFVSVLYPLVLFFLQIF